MNIMNIRLTAKHIILFIALSCFVFLLLNPSFYSLEIRNADFVPPEDQSSEQPSAAFISPELLDYLENETFAPVIVVFSAKAYVEETPETSAAAVTAELQKANRLSEQQIMPLLEEEISKGNLFDYKPLWIINAFSARVNREGLEMLSRSPHIETIYLDRQRNYLSGLSEPSVTAMYEPGNASPAERLLDEFTGEGNELHNLQAINVPRLWDEGFYGEGIVIAIMDTGVDASHSALADSYRGNVPGFSHKDSWFDATDVGGGINRDSGGSGGGDGVGGGARGSGGGNGARGSSDPSGPKDNHGHGTYIAGIILGGTKEKPMGIAPEASWIGINIFSDGYAWDSHITQAFQWLLAPGGNPDAAPHIVNCSWASRPEFAADYLHWEILYYLEKAGILVFFAAGNNGEEGPGSPASYPHAFSVGALSRERGEQGDNTEGVLKSGGNINTGVNTNTYEATEFSGRGPVRWQDIFYTKPDAVAPGVNIVSAWPGNAFAIQDGTSTATAHLSGAAALLLSAKPELTPSEAKYLLKSTASWDPLWDLEGKRPNNVYGYGLIDAYAAVMSDTLLPPELLFHDDAEEGVAHWRTTPDNPWKISREIVSQGKFAFASSPWEGYTNNSNSWLTLIVPVPMCGYYAPALTFQHFYDLQTGYLENDYAFVEISVDGVNWGVLYRFSGSNGKMQTFSIPINLPDASHDLYIRFRLQSNNNGPGRGWYLDELKVSASPLPHSALDSLKLKPPTEGTRLNVEREINIEAEGIFCYDIHRKIPPEYIIWSSSNPAVAQIENGILTGLAPGESTIRGTLGQHIAELRITITQ